MKLFPFAAALALGLATAACGDNRTAGRDESGSAEGDAYSATGTITEISDDRITISHGPVEGLGWPAMTMTFRANAAETVQGVRVGDRVEFQFRKAGGQYAITSLSKAP
jgi:Cu/Ag efflux protein CusF